MNDRQTRGSTTITDQSTRPPVSSPGRTRRHGEMKVTVTSHDKHWKDRTTETLAAVARHHLTHPDCREYTVLTIKDNRVTPPRITQDATCESCHQPLA
jgi:hypothetical protein